MTRSFLEMVLIVSIAILIGLLVNLVSPKGIPLFGNWDPSEGSLHAGGPCKPDTNEVSQTDITALYLDKNVLFVDARTAGDYREGHIQRAVSLPVYEFEKYYPDFDMQFPFEMTIVCYCLNSFLLQIIGFD